MAAGRGMERPDCEGLGNGPPTVNVRVEFLIALRAWDAVVAEGPAAVEPLVALLQPQYVNVRCNAAEALGKLRNARGGTANCMPQGPGQLAIRIAA